MILSQYQVAPRQGHLDRAKRIFGYLKKYKYGAIHIRTGLPDHSKFVDQAFDWMYSVYGSVTEDLPKNAPVPFGKRVVTTTYKDANLYHDWTTGRAVTGILHFLNGTQLTGTPSNRTQSRPLPMVLSLSLLGLQPIRLSIFE